VIVMKYCKLCGHLCNIAHLVVIKFSDGAIRQICIWCIADINAREAPLTQLVE
jgi:hypothetical protein